MRGLEVAFADGSFQRLLENDDSFKAIKERVNLAKRTILEVDNPNLTPSFRKIPAKYFAKPDIFSIKRTKLN